MAAKLICGECGSVTAKPKTVTKGNIGIEILLWLMFLVPGVFYSIWRLTTRHKACPQCGSGGLLPVDTPMGRKLFAELNAANP
jgi:ribosomal protein S27AE